VRAVVQRVSEAAVYIEGAEHSRIGPGLLVLVGVAQGDTPDDAELLANKIMQLRVFEDSSGRMNLSLLDTGGQLMAVSQFTLLGDCRKGRRPSFAKAAPPENARVLYEHFLEFVRVAGVSVETGVFRAMMDVKSTNHGPVTLLIDSDKNF
jgi:D-tyrosyl-tRNA(Tyr) deacylase